MNNLKQETIADIVNEMRGNAEHNHALVEVSKYLTEIADRIEEAGIMRVSMRMPETNFDRFAFLPEMEHGAQISTAFSFYLEEQYSPKLRGGVCMDRAYYDFLLWLFSAPGKKGATK